MSELDLKIDYNEQMLNYYPEVIKAIREFQLLTKTQSLEVEALHEELTKILSNAYLIDADHDRLSQWESFLGITPLPQGESTMENWLSDRRETILARLYNVQKLNSQSIANVVNIFTGGSAISYFKNGTIHIFITPPPGNKQYQFLNVEQELKNKIPAHLSLQVERNYFTWGEIESTYDTWGDVESNLATWEDVLLSVPFEVEV